MQDVDAVVVGSGPNGLAAAIVLAQAGLVGPRPRGGGHRRRRRALGRADAAGIRPRRLLGDPSARGRVAVLPHAAARRARRRVDRAAGRARASVRRRYRGRCSSARRMRPRRASATTRPLAAASSRRSRAMPSRCSRICSGRSIVPSHPLALGRFGARAAPPATTLARLAFRGEKARGVFAGLSAHSMLRLDRPPSAAFGLMLGLLAHAVGWPLPRGGSQRISDALASYLRSLGGEIETGHRVESLAELGDARPVLLDVDAAAACSRWPATGSRAATGAGSSATATGRACSSSTGRSTGRSRGEPRSARAPRPCTSEPRWRRSQRRRSRRDAARSRSGRTSCSPSRACSTRRARRRGSTRPGRTATSRTARRST